MKRIISFLFLIMSLYLMGQVDKEYIRKLVDKIDSIHIKEREEALNKLKKLAKDDEKILQFLQSESENESNSYNTRFFLKKLIQDIEKNNDKQKMENQENTTSNEKENEDENSIQWQESIIQDRDSKISITLCTNNKCKQYEASSCKELLQKYPELQGKIDCRNDKFTFNWNNGKNDFVEDIIKRFKRFEKDMREDLFNRHKWWNKRWQEIFGNKRFRDKIWRKNKTLEEEKLSRGEKYKYSSFGFDTQELTEEELKNLNIDNGVKVKNIEKEGWGKEVLKLQENDIIISINNEKIYNNWILKRELNAFFNGKEKEITLEIMRDGKVQKLTIER